MRRLFLVISSALAVSFIPNRTPMRDRIFLGIKDSAPAPMIATGAIVALPPAASIQGVNATALGNSDLHEYGSMGVPVEVLEARKISSESEGSVATPIPKSFIAQQSSSSAKETARHALDFFSILWLIVIVIACVVFLGAALREANKKRRIVKVGKPDSGASAASVSRPTSIRSRPASVVDKRIDREAYVYVDGG